MSQRYYKRQRILARLASRGRVTKRPRAYRPTYHIPITVIVTSTHTVTTHDFNHFIIDGDPTQLFSIHHITSRLLPSPAVNYFNRLSLYRQMLPSICEGLRVISRWISEGLIVNDVGKSIARLLGRLIPRPIIGKTKNEERDERNGCRRGIISA